MAPKVLAVIHSFIQYSAMWQVYGIFLSSPSFSIFCCFFSLLDTLLSMQGHSAYVTFFFHDMLCPSPFNNVS